MTEPDESSKLDFFPTVDEVVNDAPVTKCDECGRQFQNSSACRFHQLKHHSVVDSPVKNEQRIIRRTSDQPRVIMAFHCPDSSCSSKKRWFDGLRNLKQHYFRAHAEKKFICEMCGYKTALEKDINYHKKTRCSVLRKLKTQKTDESRPKCNKKRRKNQGELDESDETPQSAPSTTTVLQPVYFVVNPENVHSVIDTIQKSFNTPTFSAEVATQAHIPFPQQSSQIPMYSTTATTTSFATQYDQEPVTFCERGTMMNEQEPLNYFSPPYGAEFGDLTPPHAKTQPFDYSMPSTSQPETRSFGTMFENVTTCNTGTSMIDESSYVSEFLRDIETQTPSYMIQHQQRTNSGGSTSSDNWTSSWVPRDI